MGGVFRQRQDAESENSGALEVAGFGGVGETFFFGSVSLTRIVDARPFGAGCAVRATRVGVNQKK